MDKLTQYHSIVKETLSKIANRKTIHSFPLKTHFIIDPQTGHYLLYRDGWRGETRIYGCFIHVQVAEDGKVWLHHDGTDLAIGQDLLDAGIPKSDMVVGFHPPIMRPDTEFALG